jgi:uncharacterized protein with PQ loop repeat
VHHPLLCSAAQENLQTGETGDLSLRMLLLLAAVLGLWTIYGLIRADPVIIAANATSLALLSCIIYFKLREASANA